jgi:hypothetical protein
MFRTFVAVFVLTSAALAQPIGVGLKVGGLLNDVLTNRNFPTFAPFSAEAHRYILGPYVELRIPEGLSVEANALYRQYDFTTAGVTNRVGAWEFPLLLKHKLFGSPIRPYFEGGLAIGALSGAAGTPYNHRVNYGIVAGGGVEVKALFLRVSPEIRYNGWAFRYFDANAQSSRNQVELLVGIGF